MKKEYVIKLLAGMFLFFGFVLSYSGYNLLGKYSECEVYYIDGHCGGLGLGTDWIHPVKLEIWIEFMKKFNNTKFRFELRYNTNRNITQNVLLFFPFKILRMRGSNLELNYTNLPQGCAIWGKINPTQIGPNVEYGINGNFYIHNTFIQGTNGKYQLVFPFYKNVKDEELREIREVLRLSFRIGGYEFIVNLRYPDYYTFINAIPNVDEGPIIEPEEENNYQTMSWNMYEYSYPISVQLESQDEIVKKEKNLFQAGLFLGIGIPMIFQGINDLFKTLNIFK